MLHLIYVGHDDQYIGLSLYYDGISSKPVLYVQSKSVQLSHASDKIYETFIHQKR